MMKTKQRIAIAINVKSAAGMPEARFRIVSKPSRYHATRFWVVVPCKAGPDRWVLVPSLEEAMAMVARRILATNCDGHESKALVSADPKHSA